MGPGQTETLRPALKAFLSSMYVAFVLFWSTTSPAMGYCATMPGNWTNSFWAVSSFRFFNQYWPNSTIVGLSLVIEFLHAFTSSSGSSWRKRASKASAAAALTCFGRGLFDSIWTDSFARLSDDGCTRERKRSTSSAFVIVCNKAASFWSTI